jgi:hypothetical protein
MPTSSNQPSLLRFRQPETLARCIHSVSSPSKDPLKLRRREPSLAHPDAALHPLAYSARCTASPDRTHQHLKGLLPPPVLQGGGSLGVDSEEPCYLKPLDLSARFNPLLQVAREAPALATSIHSLNVRCALHFLYGLHDQLYTQLFRPQNINHH